MSNHNRMLRHLFQYDGIAYFRYFFKVRTGQKLRLNWHHLVIEHTLQKVLDLKIKRLIINIPPAHTKTELAVINFISRCLAIYPKSRYLHLSYSKNLALGNSSKIREIINLQEYQDLFPTTMKKDSDAKGEWHTNHGGSIKADSAGGQVTGFRAGFMGRDKFTGALIIDDPVKPDDAKSDIMRQNINSRFNSTIRSRLNHDEIPIIVIMQRIHEEDLTGFLLNGGSLEKWHHLCIPATLDNYEVQKYDYSVPMDLNVLLREIKQSFNQD